MVVRLAADAFSLNHHANRISHADRIIRRKQVMRNED